MNKRRRDILWAAGIVEGEGSTYIARSKHDRYTYPRIQVRMTDKDVLEEFARIMGYGNVTGPYDDTRYVEPKPMYVWSVQGPLARQMMLRLRPYLLERRQQKIDFVLRETSALRQH